MAWKAPKTWLAEVGITAGELNTYVRDNLLELGPAKVTAAGELLVTSGANSVAGRSLVSANATAAVTTTSTSPTTLGSGTPSVSVTHGGGMLIFWASRISKLSGGGIANVGPQVVGESTADASIARATRYHATRFWRAAGHVLFYNLPPGTDEVRLMYWTADGEAEYAQRSICVWPL